MKYLWLTDMIWTYIDSNPLQSFVCVGSVAICFICLCVWQWHFRWVDCVCLLVFWNHVVFFYFVNYIGWNLKVTWLGFDLQSNFGKWLLRTWGYFFQRKAIKKIQNFEIGFGLWCTLFDAHIPLTSIRLSRIEQGLAYRNY